MIDPEFWSDEEIGKWGMSARLFYIGLWNFSDDSGRFKAHFGLLKSQIFPYDDPKTIKIENYKKVIGNKVVWYEVNGCQYGYLRNFNKHQRIDRPQPSKLPSPPQDKIDEPSTNNPRTLKAKSNQVNIREEKSRENTNLDCKTDLYKILKPLPLKTTDGLLELFCSGLKERSRCYDREKCKVWLKEQVNKAVAHNPDNLYGYLKTCIESFHKGEGYKA